MKDTPSTLLMRKARINLLTSMPFLGGLGMRFEIEEAPTLDTTMSTDGRRLFFNPEICSSLKFEEVKGLIGIHTLRCTLGHPYRRGARDPDLWQKAGELAVTPLLSDMGLSLPSGAMMQERFRDHSAEQIFAVLKREQQEGNPNQREPQQGCSHVDDADEAEGREQENTNWKLATLQAQMVARKHGALPAAAQRLLEEIAHPPLDWRVLTRRFVTQAAKNDFRWYPANRRYLSQGLILPSQRSEEIGEMVVWIDCSGSTQSVLPMFGAELKAIWEDIRPRQLHIVWVDAAVHKIETIEPGDTFPELVSPAAGGTDFRPAFQWVEDNDVSPACAVYLTDMMGFFPDPENEPTYPVLWCASAPYPPDYEPNFGDVVMIKED